MSAPEEPLYLIEAREAFTRGQVIANENAALREQQFARLKTLVRSQIADITETFERSPQPEDLEQIIKIILQGSPRHPELSSQPRSSWLRFFTSRPQRPFTSIVRSLEHDLGIPPHPALPQDGLFIPDETDMIVVMSKLTDSKWYQNSATYWEQFQKGERSVAIRAITTQNKQEPENFFSICADQEKGVDFAPRLNFVATMAPTKLGLLRFEATINNTTLPLSSTVDISYSNVDTEERFGFATSAPNLPRTTRAIIHVVNDKLRLR